MDFIVCNGPLDRADFIIPAAHILRQEYFVETIIFVHIIRALAGWREP